MKKLLLILAFTGLISVRAQNIKDSSFLVSASHNVALNQITISWTTTDASGFQIQRKSMNTINWDNPIGNVAGTVSSFTDTTAKKGELYEYRILKTKGNRVRAVGYVAAGIAVPLRDYKRNVLILVDSSTYNGIDSSAWKTLKNDYYMDGYGVDLKLISEYSKPPAIKLVINSWYNINKNLNNQVLLVGRVPVAYSGSMLANTIDLPPDAHPDHGGAWPTDCYYAEMNGNWTDVNTMITNVTRADNKNVPGDGKFDQHFLPDDLDIQIGRVDFRNLPAQGSTDIKLVEQYLRKLHNYKSAAVKVPSKGFISDNFGYLGGEMPMRSGWNNASSIVGKTNIRSTGNYFDSAKVNAYLYANVMGGGSFTTCGGVGSSSQFKDSILSVFNVMFGSYFGDWNTTDNILKSCLASKGLTLTNVWAHRPHWYFHQMAMGLQVGHSVITSQNNLTDFNLASGYIGSFNGTYLDRRISMNLLGDPTLRLSYLNMPSNLTATKVNGNTDVTLTWDASSEPGLLGYNIYRTNKKGDVYYGINTSPVTGLTFTDNNPYAGTNYYIVKAVKMENGTCGTYMNSSLGIMAAVDNVNGNNTGIERAEVSVMSIYPNPATETVSITGVVESTVQVLDINGRVIFSGKSTEDKLSINVSEWSKGIYIIVSKRDNKIETGKLVIQ